MIKRAIRTALCVLATVALLAGCKADAPAATPATDDSAAAGTTAKTPPAATPAPSAIPAPAKTYDSPEAVFAAAKEAVAAKDYATFCDTIEPEARKKMAVGMVMVLGFLTMMDKGIAPKITELTKKYGVPEMKPVPGQDQAQVIQEMANGIKDPKGLIVDAMSLMEQTVDAQVKAGKIKEQGPTGPVYGVLDGLKVEGDAATATMKATDGKKDKPMTFTKIGGTWYLAPEMKM